jgi:TolA-binding protein
VRRFLGLVALVVGLLAAVARGAEDAPGRGVPSAKDAVAPAAPALPADVIAALQEKRFAEAIVALETLAADPRAGDTERAYYALVRGIAGRLAGRHDEARAGLKGAIARAPQGPWAAKLRGELAAVEVAAGRFAAAEELARAEAETLLADGRKDRLAEVYHAFARRLLEPQEPTTPADPEGAYALLGQARARAKGQALGARLLLEMARASQAANNPARAIQDFEIYLKEYPEGADRAAARFHLGEAQLAAGQPLPARLTWTDLARDLEGQDTKDAVAFRARALFQVARTYGLPNPPDDAQMNLGVAALRRFLDASASHPLAVTASYEIGASYLARGKSQQALEALTAFLQGKGVEAEADDARRDRTRLSMAAQFQVGQILQGQERFAAAIEAFRAYLARFPDGPQSADAQRAILDTQLRVAQDLLRREEYAKARAAWEAFVAQNPLDARVPQVLFQVGESFALEEKFDAAIAAWETLAGKFPGTEPAAHAQFQIAATLEAEKADPAAAIGRFRAVAVEPWQAQARQRVAVMEAKALSVLTPRAFRSGETAHLKVATRNIETLTFTAYKLDPEAYFRKKHALQGVEALDIGLVAPDAEWTAEVGGYAKYTPIEATYELKSLAVPGVWVVKVTDEKALQATTLVLGSDLDAIVKASREQILVFAQDMKTGKGRPGARVLVSDGARVLLDAKTGADGVLLKGWDKPRDPNSPLAYLVLDGSDVAGSGLAVPQAVAQGLSARAYLYTDRPAYRPGQEVNLRGVVREVADGQYAHVPKAVYRLEVFDSRGRQFVGRAVTLSDFGTFSERLPVDEGAPVGTYRVRLYQPGKSDFAGGFEVQAYQLEKVDLTIDLPRTVYYRGETIHAEVIARYQYGTPLAGRPVRVQLPDGRVLDGTTDAAGKFAVELPTEGFAEEQALRLVAQLPQDNVAAAAVVMLAVRAFRIDLATPRDVYLDGESIPLRVTTLDAQGEPTGQALGVSVLKQVEQAGRTVEREVAKATLATDPKTGVGTLGLPVEDADGGRYVVRVAGTDRFGNPVVAEKALTISGKKDETKLRLLADRQTFKVGETGKVLLHSRSDPGLALLTWEADRILGYRLVEVREGDNPVSWEVVGAQFPNFTLTAARMAGTRFHEARLDVRVERDLRVTVAPVKPAVGPGEAVEVEVTTADGLGRPVAAELSVALIDRALLRLYDDPLPPIGPFFY